jgi:hypothetical protein
MLLETEELKQEEVLKMRELEEELEKLELQEIDT